MSNRGVRGNHTLRNFWVRLDENSIVNKGTCMIVFGISCALEPCVSHGPLSTYSLLPYHVTRKQSLGANQPVFLILWSHGITISLLKL